MSDLTEAEMEAALERFMRNQLAIQELQEEQEAIKGFFKASSTLTAGTTLVVGKFYIKVSGHTRIDQKLAEKNLDYRKLNAIEKRAIDPQKARRVLTDAELASITKVYDNRIEIGLV